MLLTRSQQRKWENFIAPVDQKSGHSAVLQRTGCPQKVSHYQMIKNSYYIVLKTVGDIKFIRQIKVI